jgi:protein TonB
MVSHFAKRIGRDRLKAGTAVVLFHLLLGYALLTGLGTRITSGISDNLKVFQVPPEAPPPPLPDVQPAKERTPQEEGAAAPPNLKSRPTPIVAPPPKIRLDVPPPVTTAPLPSPINGSDASAGASNVPGPGTGAGGIGNGTGSGGQGTGPGGGGGGARAVRVSGSISGASDYPRAAKRAGIEGSVAVRFTVRADGSVGDCEVLKSSANEELDETTCRLIERRFRYEPARDAEGRPTSEIVRRTFDWMLPRR